MTDTPFSELPCGCARLDNPAYSVRDPRWHEDELFKAQGVQLLDQLLGPDAWPELGLVAFQADEAGVVLGERYVKHDHLIQLCPGGLLGDHHAATAVDRITRTRAASVPPG